MAVANMDKIRAQIADLQAELNAHEKYLKDNYLPGDEFTAWLKKKKSLQGKLHRRRQKISDVLPIKRSPSKCIPNMFDGKYAWQCPYCKQWWYSQQSAKACKKRNCATSYEKRWGASVYDGGQIETFYPIDPSKIF
jgi:hypothetical protein